MNIIIVGKRHGESRSIRLSSAAKHMLLGLLFALPMAMGAAGYWLAERFTAEAALDSNAARAWERDLVDQRQELELLREQTDREMAALTVRLAELQGRVLRLDAVGERLVDSAGLASDEFDFAAPPAMGGPVTISDSIYQVPEITSALRELSDRIDSREQQLAVLDDLMAANKLSETTFVAGTPITKGWMSSRFGYRADPFTGRSTWHAGVDFAGKDGSDIVAVASGVVTWATDRYGYGNLVEINHGNGYKTRYAHCKEIKVSVGDVVRKGDLIALMGSTGRSTGPHVHFEVYKNGRSVDPAAYIHRRPR
ncbi:M23 family metallopeptidase [Thalassolituus sp.]|jgi:murein DD-endopeptidase MepM/ murein hydrolase activator NlpD|uniref:M23 family metallopeptidase n=1 Tax=Thalassolituus sp. TaxID=2030822 RepID=UPI003515FB51